MYERNVLKKLKKELSKHWNSAWSDVGVPKHYSYVKDFYCFNKKVKSFYEYSGTVGNYRVFRIYQRYVPSTDDIEIVFGLEYDEGKEQFYVAYIVQNHYPDNETFHIKYLEDFDVMAWFNSKDDELLYKLVFPSWDNKGLHITKDRINLDFCSYVEKYVNVLKKKEEIERDF